MLCHSSERASEQRNGAVAELGTLSVRRFSFDCKGSRRWLQVSNKISHVNMGYCMYVAWKLDFFPGLPSHCTMAYYEMVMHI